MVETAINELLAASDAFVTPLRMREGFDETRYEELCKVLRTCAAAWSESDSIPKLAVNVLVDLWPAVQSCSYLYDGDVAERIMMASDVIADLTRAITVIKT